MEYLKVGRGGAGNYYSPQDIKAAEKPTAEVSNSKLPSAFQVIDLRTRTLKDKEMPPK